MKKFLFALAGCAILISCNDSKTSEEHDDHKDQAKLNEQHSAEVYRALETGDVSKLDSFFTEDVIDHNGGPTGQDIVGRDSVKKTIADIHNYFENLKVNVISQSTSEDGNYHFALVNMKGKAKANPWGMPVGMDMDDTMVDVMKIKDGRASEHWGFMSMGDVNEMMKGMSSGGQPTTDTTAKK